MTESEDCCNVCLALLCTPRVGGPLAGPERESSGISFTLYGKELGTLRQKNKAGHSRGPARSLAFR